MASAGASWWARCPQADVIKMALNYRDFFYNVLWDKNLPLNFTSQRAHAIEDMAHDAAIAKMRSLPIVPEPLALPPHGGDGDPPLNNTTLMIRLSTVGEAFKKTWLDNITT
jgi:hypothetical protein